MFSNQTNLATVKTRETEVAVTCSYEVDCRKLGRGHKSKTWAGALISLDIGKMADFNMKTTDYRICPNFKNNVIKALILRQLCVQLDSCLLG